MVTKDKNKLYTISAIVLLILAAIIVLVVLRGVSGEDTWIKDSRGVWIPHGNPANLTQAVREQREIIYQADLLFRQLKANNTIFSSQCLGTVNSQLGVQYSVDIVHTPRTSEDDIQTNQCNQYLLGNVSHFIELNQSGSLVRIQ